ncbi:MAG TPA: DNA-binding response regulator [Planctomycetaceae bacterium]|nr:DNA-binding response regulator [Planctomycetaceae bacterium]
MINHLPATHHQNHAVDTVYLVDDRPTDMLMIRRLCESVSLEAKVFSSPNTFLEQTPRNATGCLIVDLLMPEMSGLELYRQLKRRKTELTTIIITGFADATSCRSGFQAGVFDFIEKDFSPEELLSVIRSALEHNRTAVRDRRIRDSQWRRIEDLTAREMDVARLLSEGNVLKEIGAKLSISVQTASKHRSSIFDKLQVNNEVELHQAYAHCMSLLEEAM